MKARCNQNAKQPTETRKEEKREKSEKRTDDNED
jgi:hypothetical protein